MNPKQRRRTCDKLFRPISNFRIDDVTLPRINDDRIGYGYFQLFTQKIRVCSRSRYDAHWRHGGNYNATLLLRWPHCEEL
jgi:hypothetical protein